MENLFYNVPARLSALRSSSEEYARILDVVTKYAVHNAGVSFLCKKVFMPPCDGPRVSLLTSSARLAPQPLTCPRRLPRPSKQSACYMVRAYPRTCSLLRFQLREKENESAAQTMIDQEVASLMKMAAGGRRPILPTQTTTQRSLFFCYL